MVGLWIKYCTKWESVAKSTKLFCISWWSVVDILESKTWNSYSYWAAERTAFLKDAVYFIAKKFVLSSSLGKEKESSFVLLVCQERYCLVQRWYRFCLMANYSYSWYHNSVEFYLNPSIKRMILLRPSFIFC